MYTKIDKAVGRTGNGGVRVPDSHVPGGGGGISSHPQLKRPPLLGRKCLEGTDELLTKA